MQTQTWYQVIAGIIAIPVAVISFFYSVLLIRKGRLEARKLELEIREKESQLEKPPPPVTTTVTFDQQVQNFVLRFILFALLIIFWTFAGHLADSMYEAVALSYTLGKAGNFKYSLFMIISTAVKYCLGATIVTIGVPLFIEINKHQGIRWGYLLYPFKKDK